MRANSKDDDHIILMFECGLNPTPRNTWQTFDQNLISADLMLCSNEFRSERTLSPLSVALGVFSWWYSGIAGSGIIAIQHEILII